MLNNTNETKFSVIEIKPSKHNILPQEIINDHVVEATNPLHNYIRRNVLFIDETDIIYNFEIDPLGIKDVKLFEKQLSDLDLITELE